MTSLKKVPCFSENAMRNAVLKVVKKGYSIRGVAGKCNISYASLRKYVNKYYKTETEKRKKLRFFPNYEVNQIFSKELEDTLEEYLIMIRKMHYGLTLDHIKRCSYELAVKNKLKVPQSWVINKKAGKHWLYGYLKRHPSIYKIVNWCKIFRPPIKKLYNVSIEVGKPEYPSVNKICTVQVPSDQIGQEVKTQLNSPVVIISMKKFKKFRRKMCT